jgi:demethylmenaquinone methyltransferase/2-methoxy-6-polyprenyl-1,4-benzoquinol methylase
MIMIRDPYQRTAKSYDTLVEPFNTVIRKIGFKLFPPKQGMRVLDVGCGTGTNLDIYHMAGCKAFGLDLSPAMLEEARRKLGKRAELRLGDASQMPYPDAFFDLVISMLTLHEMPISIRPAVMSEMIRVLKQDGRILLIDFHPGPIRFPKGWFYRAVILSFELAAGREHFRNYRDFLASKGLPRLISSHGLSVEKKKIVSGGNIGLFLVKLI